MQLPKLLRKLQDLRMRIVLGIQNNLRLPTVKDRLAKLVGKGECSTALDIGCGIASHLSVFRPGLTTFGIDASLESLEVARHRGVHDHYLHADLMKLSAEQILAETRRQTGIEIFDLVTAFGVIEHFPKHSGWELLRKCEQLTSKYVVIDTPNGFLEQGPEYNNPYQRHLSGWFVHDFEGLGFTVSGDEGTKYLRGYMGEPRYPIPGCRLFDFVVLSRLLQADKNPQHAFSLVGIKDVRGVPARHQSR